MSHHPSKRLGHTQRLVLKLIERQPTGITSKELRDKTAAPDSVSAATRSLFARGAIHIADAGWRISPLGEQLLNSQTPPLPKPVGLVAGPRTMHSASTYTGAELRPQQARPAGNAAIYLPSLINGVRVAPTLYPSPVNTQEP